MRCHSCRARPHYRSKPGQEPTMQFVVALYSDQGRQLECQVTIEVCNLFKNRKTYTTTKGDGLVEHLNRTLLHTLATTVKEHEGTWEDVIQRGAVWIPLYSSYMYTYSVYGCIICELYYPWTGLYQLVKHLLTFYMNLIFPYKGAILWVHITAQEYTWGSLLLCQIEWIVKFMVMYTKCKTWPECTCISQLQYGANQRSCIIHELACIRQWNSFPILHNRSGTYM